MRRRKGVQSGCPTTDLAIRFTHEMGKSLSGMDDVVAPATCFSVSFMARRLRFSQPVRKVRPTRLLEAGFPLFRPNVERLFKRNRPYHRQDT